MSFTPSLPTLEFYTRKDCALCDYGRAVLQQVLEDRVMRGDPVPRVREIDLGRRPDLEPSHGARLPVIAMNGEEIALVGTYRAIARFLDRALGRLA